MRLAVLAVLIAPGVQQLVAATRRWVGVRGEHLFGDRARCCAVCETFSGTLRHHRLRLRRAVSGDSVDDGEILVRRERVHRVRRDLLLVHIRSRVGAPLRCSRRPEIHSDHDDQLIEADSSDRAVPTLKTFASRMESVESSAETLWSPRKVG